MEQSTALTLPDEVQFRRDIQAINKFQQVVHACMIKDQDYGVIPGTTKPTLLKPGAEKIAKLLGLADTYEILDKAEEWDKPFFRYLVKCKLIHVKMNVVISEGMGECNSLESKYRWRWVGERDIPEGMDTSKMVTQERKGKNGGHWTVYRLDNDDIYSQVNTILKMAKKRALVDAALSAGRLSDVFTQDIEDIPSIAQQDFTTERPAERARTEPEKTEHYCQEHGVNFFKRGKMKGYAHPIGDTGEWCNEDKAEPKKAQEASPGALEPPLQQSDCEDKAETQEGQEDTCFVNLEWLQEQLGILQGKGIKAYSNANVIGYLNDITGGHEKKVSDACRRLTKEQAEAFTKRVQDAIEMA